MKWSQIIGESVGMTVLYHAAPIDHLYEMLEDDEIKPNTGHPITHTGGERRSNQWAIRPSDVTANGYLKGVSLTRNIFFARAWKANGAILVLNGDLIKRACRMIPISFFGGRRTITHEAEEFIIGPLKPLSKFLIHVEVSQQTLEQNPLMTDIPAFSALFPSQPKIVVIGTAWRATGLNKGTVSR
jgi:hypothetical protein